MLAQSDPFVLRVEQQGNEEHVWLSVVTTIHNIHIPCVNDYIVTMGVDGQIIGQTNLYVRKFLGQKEQ